MCVPFGWNYIFLCAFFVDKLCYFEYNYHFKVSAIPQVTKVVQHVRKSNFFALLAIPKIRKTFLPSEMVWGSGNCSPSHAILLVLNIAG